MTRRKLQAAARSHVERRFKEDPERTEERVLAVLGSVIFAWEQLSVAQLLTLKRV